MSMSQTAQAQLARLTGISAEDLSSLKVQSFDDVVCMADNEVQGLELRQQQKLRAVTGFLLDGNTISDDTSMIQIMSHLKTKAKANDEDRSQKMLQRSQVVVDSWCQELTNPPTVGDLQSAVNALLPKPLPSPYGQPTTSLDKPVADVLSVTHEDALLIPELASLQTLIYSISKFGDNEDSVHGLVDALVLAPMKIVADGANCNFRWNRNGADATGATVKSLRPDVLVWLPSGVLAFKGEDKALESDLHLARNELVVKLGTFSDAFFGSVPYQICYAAGGYSLEFVVIARDPAGGRPTLTRLTDSVDLSTVRGRSLCVRYAVNIARVLVSLHKAHPEGSVIRLGSMIQTPSSKVEVFGDFVRKRTNVHTGYVLNDLYKQVAQSRAPCLVYAHGGKIKVTRNGLTVHIAPVGFCGRRPESLAEVKRAGRCILMALHWLHSNGWVHRDIRPQNVMFANGGWYLMDLEWANTVDLEIAHYRPQEEFTPPELLGVDGAQWTTACDMWQFGHLIETWGHLDADGLDYVATQLSTPANRLSAEESLEHAFFN